MGTGDRIAIGEDPVRRICGPLRAVARWPPAEVAGHGYGSALDRAGVSGRLRQSVLEPFLAGVLAEDGQESSRRFVDLLLRMFARGVPSLPRDGMQSLPQQIADLLPAGTVRLDSVVHSVGEVRVARTDDGEWTRACLVVATDPGTAAGSPRSRHRGCAA